MSFLVERMILSHEPLCDEVVIRVVLCHFYAHFYYYCYYYLYHVLRSAFWMFARCVSCPLSSFLRCLRASASAFDVETDPFRFSLAAKKSRAIKIRIRLKITRSPCQSTMNLFRRRLKEACLSRTFLTQQQRVLGMYAALSLPLMNAWIFWRGDRVFGGDPSCFTLSVAS